MHKNMHKKFASFVKYFSLIYKKFVNSDFILFFANLLFSIIFFTFAFDVPLFSFCVMIH